MIMGSSKVGISCIALAVGLTGCGGTNDRVSRPFEYRGYSTPQFDGHSKSSTYVEMSDGARIAADVYLPTGHAGAGEAPRRFPTVFIFTPYLRTGLDPDTGEVIWTSFELSANLGAEGLLPYGYAIVVADTRGHGASSSNSLTFGLRYQQDAGEVVDWIAAQPWCDGNVGMIGGSHVGWTQLAAASRKPEALKAIMPGVVPFDGFTGQFYPGGIYMQGFLEGAGLSGVHRKHEEERARMVPAPVVDEDGDGELIDEIPLDLDGSGSFLDDHDPDGGVWPPRYADGNSRDDIFYHAIRDRPDVEWFDWSAVPGIDVRAPSGESSRDLCSNLVEPIAESGIAIYHVGGWFDGFARGTMELYATLAGTNPSRVMMFPGFHRVWQGFMFDHFGVDPDGLATERLRFFDRYLKGIDNGIDREPPVLIYNMHGDGWRQESEWPLARQRIRTLHLARGDRLSESAGEPGADEYRVNLAHDRRYGSNLSSRWMGLGHTPPDEVPDMTDRDADSLIYTSAALEEDTEVTGHPIARLWVSSTAEDGDFFVFLEDVDGRGRSLMVTEGQLRAGWADLYDNDGETDTGIEVLPELPWHGYEQAQWQQGILADGNVVELVIDLLPTSWTFKAGHRIRLAVTGANWPDFALNPTLSPANDPAAPDNIVPTILLHRGGERASVLELPVIPRAR